jgi:hypothetical protein
MTYYGQSNSAMPLKIMSNFVLHVKKTDEEKEIWTSVGPHCTEEKKNFLHMYGISEGIGCKVIYE